MSESPDSGAAFSATEYFKLADEGLIAPDERVERLEGMMIEIMPGGVVEVAELFPQPRMASIE